MLTNQRKLIRPKGNVVSQQQNVSQRRQSLRERPESHFVHRDEFCELLLSFKKLVRSDEPAVRVRGLLDVESGARYLIEQEELFGSGV